MTNRKAADEEVAGLAGASPRWREAFEWIGRELGGRIVKAERQPRWRPAFFLELEREGEALPLYFRGRRGEVASGDRSLEIEAGVLRVLEANGIPVPHVHCLCPEPAGIVMDRAPGRANLATAASEAQRRAVLDHYVDILAEMHAIDPAEFAGLGLRQSTTDRALGLGDFEHWVSGYRTGKARPEPEIEFLIRWVDRNVPVGRRRRCFVCADAGQFLFEGERVTALIDFELAYIGDPAADLGALLTRDLSEPLGDLRPAIARYEARVGETVPRDVIAYHAIRFSTCTPLAVAPMVARAIPGLDFVQYLSWYVIYARTPIELIAEGMGLPLEDVPEPEGLPTRHSSGHAALVDRLSTRPEGEEDAFARYERETALRVAEYLRRADAMGPGIEVANLDDLEALLGKRPSSPAEGDAALEAFVLAAGPEEDERLVPVLHRRLMRLQWLIDPVLRELRGVAMQSPR